MATMTKTSRLETRLTPQQRELIERAASISGRTLSDFVTMTLQSAAETAVRNHEVMVLSQQDQQLFVDSLLNPPKANKALKKAFKAERQLVESEN